MRRRQRTDLTAQLELLVGLALDEPAPALVALLAQAATEVAAEGGTPPTWKDAALTLAGSRGGIDEQRSATPGIRIMTMHGAKGLGADTVVVAGADHEVMHGGATGAAQFEEVRLVYVALTRAMHHLAVTFPGKRTGEHAHRRGGQGAHHLSDALGDFLNPTIEQPAGGRTRPIAPDVPGLSKPARRSPPGEKTDAF